MPIVDHVAVDGGDDAVGHRPAQLLAERVADGHNVIADLQGTGVAEFGGGEPLCVDLEHGDVAHGVCADERTRILGAVRRGHGDALRAVEHVRVRDDVAIAREHDARAGAVLAAADVGMDADNGRQALGIHALQREHTAAGGLERHGHARICRRARQLVLAGDGGVIVRFVLWDRHAAVLSGVDGWSRVPSARREHITRGDDQHQHAENDHRDLQALMGLLLRCGGLRRAPVRVVAAAAGSFAAGRGIAGLIPVGLRFANVVVHVGVPPKERFDDNTRFCAAYEWKTNIL